METKTCVCGCGLKVNINSIYRKGHWNKGRRRLDLSERNRTPEMIESTIQRNIRLWKNLQHRTKRIKAMQESLHDRFLIHPEQAKQISDTLKETYHNNPDLIIRGERSKSWKGNDVGYAALNIWIRKNKPEPKLCEICNKVQPYE